MTKKIIIAILIFVLVGFLSIALEGEYTSKISSFLLAVVAGIIGFSLAKEHYKPDERLEEQRENTEQELRNRNRELWNDYRKESNEKNQIKIIAIEPYAALNNLSTEALYNLMCSCSAEDDFFAAQNLLARSRIINELVEFNLFWENRALPCIKQNGLSLCFENLYSVRESFKNDYNSTTPLDAKLCALEADTSRNPML